MKAAFDVLAKGGLVMIPLGLCSVLALAVVIERAFRWLKLGRVSEADRVLALAGRGDWDEAARAGEQSSSPVARVLAAGLRHRNPAAGLAMEAAAQDELARLRRYLPLLDTVITLAPLLGPARDGDRHDRRVRHHVPGRAQPADGHHGRCR